MHSLSTTAANVAYVAEANRVLHGKERKVFADAGYQGVEKRPEVQGKHSTVEWEVATKRGKIKAMAEGLMKELHKGL